ncbi:MAG: hypothetical protein HFJ24_04140 [Clostridia bacterium]|nr:hypothetical protein [Clostridia bacterium]
MENIKTKFADIKERLKDRHLLTLGVIIVILIIALIALSVYIYSKERKYQMASENSYNMAFYELVNCADEIETYLAKATITMTAEHEAKTLNNIWNKANLGVVYLSQMPVKTEGLSKAEKFLNQLSDYSYSLSMKTTKGEDLSEEDLKNIKDLHNYSKDLKNTLMQLESEINDGSLEWGEVAKEGNKAFAQQVSGDLGRRFWKY